MKKGLKAKVRTEGLILDMASDNPQDIKSLITAFRAFKSFHNESSQDLDEVDTSIDEGEFLDAYFSGNSKYFRQNKEAKKLMAAFYAVEPSSVETRTSIPYCIDMNTQQLTVQLSDVAKAAEKLFEGVEAKKVSTAIIHLTGKLHKQHQLSIADEVRKRIPHAAVKIVQSKETLPKILVEAVFFGDFNQNKKHDYEYD